MGGFGFVVSIIFALSALMLIALSFQVKGKNGVDRKERRSSVRFLSGIMIVVAIIIFALSGIREVPSRSDGVPTAFGKIESDMGPGIHWKMPYTVVNILDETIQTDCYGSGCSDTKNSGGSTSQFPCIPVRIGGQQSACWNGTLQWRIPDTDAVNIFSNYNQTGTNIMSEVQSAIVYQQLQKAINDAMGDYNPIYDVSLVSTSGKGNSQFTALTTTIEKSVRLSLKGEVNVVSFLMKRMSYSAATEANIEKLQQAYVNTAIAKQLQITNTAQKTANNNIGTPSPSQLQFFCYQIVQDAVKTNFTGLPATFCLNNGQQVAIALPSKK